MTSKGIYLVAIGLAVLLIGLALVLPSPGSVSVHPQRPAFLVTTTPATNALHEVCISAEGLTRSCELK